mmetsp:Transcript_1646/g.3435  ORF Transcript_1646/g.3435 Transcript_1646/m.3435 type:complete len:84 (+) Transcript_1646:55-306(+)
MYCVMWLQTLISLCGMLLEQCNRFFPCQDNYDVMSRLDLVGNSLWNPMSVLWACYPSCLSKRNQRKHSFSPDSWRGQAAAAHH